MELSGNEPPFASAEFQTYFKLPELPQKQWTSRKHSQDCKELNQESQSIRSWLFSFSTKLEKHPKGHMLPILGTSFEFFLLSRPDKRTWNLVSSLLVYFVYTGFWCLFLLLQKVRCEEGLFYSLSHCVVYQLCQLSLLHAVLCDKVEESHVCMPMTY